MRTHTHKHEYTGVQGYCRFVSVQFWLTRSKRIIHFSRTWISDINTRALQFLFKWARHYCFVSYLNWKDFSPAPFTCKTQRKEQKSRWYTHMMRMRWELIGALCVNQWCVFNLFLLLFNAVFLMFWTQKLEFIKYFGCLATYFFFLFICTDSSYSRKNKKPSKLVLFSWISSLPLCLCMVAQIWSYKKNKKKELVSLA